MREPAYTPDTPDWGGSLNDRVWLHTQYVLRSRSITSIADQLGCTTGRVRAALWDFAIPLRTRRRTRLQLAKARLYEPGWLIEHYHGENMTIRQIAKKLRCSVKVVRTAMEQMDVTPRGVGRPRMPLLHDEEWLHKRYVVEHASLKAMAKEIRCHHSSVADALAAHGIGDYSLTRPVKVTGAAAPAAGPTTPTARIEKKSATTPVPPSRRRYPELSDRDWLLTRYETWGRTVTEIAAELGCNHRAVSDALFRQGIRSRRGGPRTALEQARSTLYSPGWLEEHYVTHSLSYEAIAGLLGCDKRMVQQAVVGLGITPRPFGRPVVEQLHDVDWLREQYVGRRRSFTDIAAEVGCHRSTVAEAVKAAGISR